jgi:muramoyltetrapeptide carboxypeptidase
MSAPSILLPPLFSVGDTLGLVAPASPPEKPEIIEEVFERFGALGFKIKPGKYLRQRDGYLAGCDEERASDINAFFADPTVKGIFALRGGYGSCRLLTLLDYDTIRSNPKPLIGYSDITAMHLAILVKTGLVTFHGSNASSAFQPENIAFCRQRLMGEDASPILFSRERPNPVSIQTVVAGRVAGQLMGGNMTCLLRLIGTPFQPDFRNVILFLEDTGEKAYRVDGMFTQLRLAGVLDQIGGLVLGQFDHSEASEEERIAACLKREAERIGVPCVSGSPIGHFAGQIIVPQGVTAELDASGGKLTMV